MVFLVVGPQRNTLLLLKDDVKKRKKYHPLRPGAGGGIRSLVFEPLLFCLLWETEKKVLFRWPGHQASPSLMGPFFKWAELQENSFAFKIENYFVKVIQP